MAIIFHQNSPASSTTDTIAVMTIRPVGNTAGQSASHAVRNHTSCTVAAARNTARFRLASPRRLSRRVGYGHRTREIKVPPIKAKATWITTRAVSGTIQSSISARYKGKFIQSSQPITASTICRRSLTKAPRSSWVCKVGFQHGHMG